ncbi:MAG: MFS transporter [Leptolyngbyaceae bacterium]|nr:MFS transporter [Leptolyngbyaceae bacterium]
MKSFFRFAFSWLPNLDRRVWILASGRLLSQIGNGFTLFYAPIFFANQVGLSATAVGIGIGSGSLSGVFGRFFGGAAADSPRWGRRKIILLSAAISAIADVFLATAFNFPTFVLGNLLMGLGIGLYWPATEAVVADLTRGDQRNEAFALARLADNLGLSLGIVFGGALIELTNQYRLLFVIDGITYGLFFVIVALAIAETLDVQDASKKLLSGWGTALRDRQLWVYAAVNVLFTMYLAQVQSTMPLYFSNVVPAGDDGTGFSPARISTLFTWYVVLTALVQLPVARWLNRLTHPKALGLSMVFWGIGFIGIAVTGMATGGHLWWAIIALTILAIATVTYLPSASAFVVDLAPDSLRGVYLSVNSQCWAIGYFIGPPLGGWALDQSTQVAHGFWVGMACSGLLGIGIITLLGRMQSDASSPSPENKP